MKENEEKNSKKYKNLEEVPKNLSRIFGEEITRLEKERTDVMKSFRSKQKNNV